MGKYNLSEAAKAILGEGSKETFDANIAAKRGQSGTSGHAPHGEVGKDALHGNVAHTHDAGKIGEQPHKMGDALPDYLKGVPSATAPGATPPVGSEPAKHLAHQPGQDKDAEKPLDQHDATDYASIRDRVKAKLAKQTFHANPGAHFQSYDEDMEALFAGEQLSEDFKSKASTIFEAAVITKAEQIAEAVEGELVEQFEAAVEQIKEELAQKLDDYISYMAEEWIKENQIAIETGLRQEIVEDFMAGLKDLFVEHYIDIPEDKVNVVEELTDKVTELESELNEQIQAAIELKKQLDESKKIEAIHAVCEGLTQTQVEKMKSLAEGVEFTTDEEFADKLVTLRESYFQSEVKVATSSALNEEVIVEEDKPAANIDPAIANYVKTISQTLVK
jgi:hypothetical protein